MKVYIPYVDTDWETYRLGVFSSREAAKEAIERCENEIMEKNEHLDEVEMHSWIDELVLDEYNCENEV